MSSNPWSGFMQKTQKQQTKTKAKSRSARKRKAPDGNGPSLESKSSPQFGPKKKRRRISKINRMKCPICNALILSNLINFHVEEHFLNTNSNANKENIPSSQSSSTSTESNHSNVRSSSTSSIDTISTTSPQSPLISTKVSDDEKVTEPVDDSKILQQSITNQMCPDPTKQSVKPLQSNNDDEMEKSKNKKTPNKNTKKKICPLFTAGALPASAFNKPKKRSAPPPAQEVIFYLDITLDDTKQHITEWKTQWIDDHEKRKEFMIQSKERGEFQTNILIREPNTIGATKVNLICNLPSRTEGPLNVQSGNFRFMYPSPHSLRFSPSLTKSLLQKCVRVSYADSAVKAAYLLLIKDGLQSLLRRLSIIVIEDLMLLEDFVVLIWLMLAESKSDPKEKYHPSLPWYNFIFGLVKMCGKCQIKDYQDYSLHPDGVVVPYINLFTPLQTQKDDIDDGDTEIKDGEESEDSIDSLRSVDANEGVKGLLIRSMLMRAAYGGMKCDVAMMRSYSCIWHNRFFGKTQHCKYYQPQLAKLKVSTQIEEILMEKETDTDRVVIQQMVDKNDWLGFMRRCRGLYDRECTFSMMDIAPIQDKDLILSAVDFHCSNMLSVICDGRSECTMKILEFLKSGRSKIYNNRNERWRNNVAGLLKAMVWEFRSSQTDKVGLLMTEEKPLELFDLWQNVKIAVNDFSLKYLQSRKGRR